MNRHLLYDNVTERISGLSLKEMLYYALKNRSVAMTMAV